MQGTRRNVAVAYGRSRAATAVRHEDAPQREWICREVLVMFLICTLDMLSSAYFFHQGVAVEANPLLRPAAEAGVLPFIVAKSLSYMPALAVMEYFRRSRPEFIQRLLRWGIAGYVLLYALLAGGQFLR